MQSHLEGLDVLRVIALSCVFLFHLLPSVFKGGWLGVEMFLILTGFLLSAKAPVYQLQEAPGFLIRKYQRLMPHVLIMVLVVCGLLGRFYPDAAYGLKEDAFHIFTGTFNDRLIKTSQDYFNSFSEGSVFTHLWTLSVELQWYLLWPFLSVFLHKLFHQDAVKGMLVCLLCAGALFMIMPAFVLASGNTSTAYYSTLARSLPVFLGILAGLQYRYGNPVGKMMKNMEKHIPWLMCASIATMLVLLLKADGSQLWLYCGGIAAIDLWCFLLVCMGAETGRIRIMNTIVRKVSSLSFGIYLFQYPLVLIANHLYGSTARSWILSTVLCLALACIEQRVFRDLCQVPHLFHHKEYRREVLG